MDIDINSFIKGGTGKSKQNPNEQGAVGSVRISETKGFLAESSSLDIIGIMSFYLNKPKEKEIVTFMRELAILVEARVPLIRALGSIRKQKYSIGLLNMVGMIQQKVEGGKSLSEAFEQFPAYFPPLYVNVTRAGEASGRLEKVLNYLADNREKAYDLKKKITGAMIYPGVIGLSFVAVFIFLMVFVMPSLSKTLTESGTKLPWTTKLILGMSAFFTSYWPFLLILLVILGFIFFYYAKTEEGKRQMDVVKLHTPIVGSLLTKMYMNQFADNFGLLLKEGVPITKSLEITSNIMENHIYQNVLLECVKEVQKGRNVSSTLELSPYFPNVVSQILRIGEESGRTSETLVKISEYYTKEVDEMTRNMMALIEPILIIFLGLGTAVIVASVIMPIYNMAGSM